MMFACLFLLQEQTYAVACYTDTWADDSGVSEQPYYEDEPADGPYIVGSGVTSMRYNEPYHDAVVITTLTSPSGQQISLEDFDVSENYKPFYARAEVELLWSDNEVGTYTISSEHRSYCPFTNFGSTQSNFPVGITYIAMQLKLPADHNGYGYLYEKVQPCDVYCNAPQTNRYPGPVTEPVACIRLEIAYGPLGCFKLVRVKRNTLSCICYDVGWN